MNTENGHGTGGIVLPRDNTIASFGEIIADSPTFDWGKGYDIRLKIGKDMKTKDQNGSGSCGGQASAYLTEAAFCLTGSTIVDGFSARSIYSRCFVPGGGSGEQPLMNVLVSGAQTETVVTSYENGNPPSEAFMETLATESEAQPFKGSRPVYVDLNFDKIATAVLQNGGVVIGIHGQNNGTWLTADPLPPTLSDMRDPNVWHHWVYVGFAGMRNGKKVLGFKNSWGDNVGEHGWQYITEDYMPYIFTTWSMIYSKNSKPKYTFNTILKFGQSSKDIVALQDVLRYEGLFSNVSTGYYGALTASAVDAFQRKYAVDTVTNLNILQGKQVGNKTLRKLNELYN